MFIRVAGVQATQADRENHELLSQGLNEEQKARLILMGGKDATPPDAT